MPLRQRHGQLGAERVVIAQRAKAQRVEPAAHLLQAGDVRAPGRRGRPVAAHAHGGEDALQQQLLRLVLRYAGKHHGRPRARRHRRHAPLHAVVRRGLAEGAQRLARGAVGARDAPRVHAGERRRIVRMDGEKRRPAGKAVQPQRAPPRGANVERRVRRVQVAKARERVVAPLQLHARAAGGVGRLRAQACKRRRLHRAGDHQRLPRLKVEPHLHEQRCILAQAGVPPRRIHPFRFPHTPSVFRRALSAHGGPFQMIAARGRALPASPQKTARFRA